MVQCSRIVLFVPTTTPPSRSGMRVCCGCPPMTVPSKIRLPAPSRVPLFTTTLLASSQSLPISTSASTIVKGPMATFGPSTACGLTTASGWIFTVADPLSGQGSSPAAGGRKSAVSKRKGGRQRCKFALARAIAGPALRGLLSVSPRGAIQPKVPVLTPLAAIRSPKILA